MRLTYLILARIIAILVVIQAMTMVFAVSGFFNWIDDGNTADSAVFKSWEDNPPDFVGSLGFMIHGISGMNLIPLLALLLLIASFFAKVPRGVLIAVVVVVSTALQVFVGLAAHDAPIVGLVHGFNAFILFGAALAGAQAAKNAGVTQVAPAQTA
jgi:hypothetical protein